MVLARVKAPESMADGQSHGAMTGWHCSSVMDIKTVKYQLQGLSTTVSSQIDVWIARATYKYPAHR